MLMNGMSTSEETIRCINEKYPSLVAEGGLEFLIQNQFPKIDATTLQVSSNKNFKIFSMQCFSFFLNNFK